MSPKIGVVIVSYNSKRYLDDLFFSLSKITYPNFLILFIDNASLDGSADYLKENYGNKFSNLTIMKLDKNSGFAIGNNIGFKYLKEQGFDYAYLLNQDTVVEADFLQRALEMMDEDTASVQSLIYLYPKDTKGPPKPCSVNTLGNAIHYLGFGYCYGYKWSKKKADRYIENWRVRDKDFNIAYSSGAGALFNMKALLRVGYFDEEFFMYHEDLDLGWRLRLAGYKNVLAPSSVIYHKYEFSKSIKKYYFMERNRYLTIFQNYTAWSLILIFPALVLMEFGLFIFSLQSGWWREKLKVYEYFLYPKNWRKLCAKRRGTQKLRNTYDKKIAKHFIGKILFQDMDNIVLRRIANPLFNFYWKIISKLL